MPPGPGHSHGEAQRRENFEQQIRIRRHLRILPVRGRFRTIVWNWRLCFVGPTTAFQPRRLATFLGRTARRRRLQTLVSRLSAKQAIVLGVRANPEPGAMLAIFDGERAMV